MAFVNKRAISAGALIALAAETIAMAGRWYHRRAVEMGLPGPAQPVAEKTVSYMRKEFRATAESRKRPCWPKRWWTRTWRSRGDRQGQALDADD